MKTATQSKKQIDKALTAKSYRVRDIINEWTKRIGWLSGARAGERHNSVIWENGGGIGEYGWVYSFGTYSRAACLRLMLNENDSGEWLNPGTVEDVAKFVDELWIEIRKNEPLGDGGIMFLDPWDNCEAHVSY